VQPHSPTIRDPVGSSAGRTVCQRTAISSQASAKCGAPSQSCREA